jgi:transglutaminase-like putative cysteine protease
MRLAIRHTTRFERDDSALYMMQRLRLRPQSGPGQTVRAWQVTIDGAEPELGYVDGLGNGIDLVRHAGTRNEIAIVAAGVVETQDRAGVVGVCDGYAPPWVFERVSGQSPEAAPKGMMEAMMDTLPAESGRLDMLHALMSSIHQLPTPDDADKEAAAAAPDAPALFIAMARHLEIPARYVTGYLMGDTSAPRAVAAMSQSSRTSEAGGKATGTGRIQRMTQTTASAAGAPQAMHAWAEAYVEGLGWVGFDPRMNRCPDERYVRLAVGFGMDDTRAVTGFGARLLATEVSVIPAPELV